MHMVQPPINLCPTVLCQVCWVLMGAKQIICDLPMSPINPLGWLFTLILKFA